MPKVIWSSSRKLLCLSASKNHLHPPCFSRDITKICKFLILGNMGMPCNTHPKCIKIVLTCSRLLHLSACQKYTSSFTSFSRLFLNNLISWQHFGSQLENQNFPRYEISGEISITICFHFRLFPRKTYHKIFQNLGSKLESFWAPFAQIWGKMTFPGKKGSIGFQIFQTSTIVPKIRRH